MAFKKLRSDLSKGFVRVGLPALPVKASAPTLKMDIRALLVWADRHKPVSLACAFCPLPQHPAFAAMMLEFAVAADLRHSSLISLASAQPMLHMPTKSRATCNPCWYTYVFLLLRVHLSLPGLCNRNHVSQVVTLLREHHSLLYMPHIACWPSLC